MITSFIENYKWIYDYGQHYNGTQILEQENYNESEDKYQRNLVGIQIKIVEEINILLDDIRLIDEKIVYLANTINKRYHADRCNNPETKKMISRRNSNSVKVKQKYSQILDKHERLLNHLK